MNVSKTLLNAKILANPQEQMSQLHWSCSCWHGILVTFVFPLWMERENFVKIHYKLRPRYAYRHFYSGLRDWNTSRNWYISVPVVSTWELERELLPCVAVHLVLLVLSYCMTKPNFTRVLYKSLSEFHGNKHFTTFLCV